MSTRFTDWDERTLDLALEELTTGLERERRDELMESVDAGELRLLERGATALNLAGLERLEQPPADLMRRIERDARAHFAMSGAPRAVPVQAPRPRRVRLRFLAAAGHPRCGAGVQEHPGASTLVISPESCLHCHW
jgi:hypothetical protein